MAAKYIAYKTPPSEADFWYRGRAKVSYLNKPFEITLYHSEKDINFSIQEWQQAQAGAISLYTEF